MTNPIDIIKRPKAKNGKGSEITATRINKYLLQALHEQSAARNVSTTALIETAIYRTYKGIRREENQLRREAEDGKQRSKSIEAAVTEIEARQDDESRS